MREILRARAREGEVGLFFHHASCVSSATRVMKSSGLPSASSGAQSATESSSRDRRATPSDAHPAGYKPAKLQIQNLRYVAEHPLP